MFRVEYACCEEAPDEFVVVDDGHQIGSVIEPLSRTEANNFARLLNDGGNYWACDGMCVNPPLAPHIHYGKNVIIPA